jgi:diguanylate cyclase
MERAHDGLTGLPSRAALDAALATALKQRDGVALALLDIDHFEAVNTEFGLDVGDGLLVKLAGLLREHAAGAYRIGGDEFALVLPGLTLEQAFLHMETLRRGVEQAAPLFDLPDKRATTVTIGVAQYPRDAKDARGVIHAAAAALEAAKEGGRNQVSLPPNEEMVMKSCYYAASSVRKLRALAERLGRKESPLLREALDDLLRKYDQPRES